MRLWRGVFRPSWLVTSRVSVGADSWDAFVRRMGGQNVRAMLIGNRFGQAWPRQIWFDRGRGSAVFAVDVPVRHVIPVQTDDAAHPSPWE